MQTIEQSTSRAGSSSRSIELREEGELKLPQIGPDDGPADWPEPSWTVQLTHAAFILSCLSPVALEERRKEMQAEPFVLD